ncbi:MAG: hypothetical protein XE03_1948 [candidate division TA06 bacterium 34_109]|uniref:Uncharacterized protein n=1 Tax=candidate division TA06 bacterium 34_109 TaxID=1635277 RepID=A0A117M5M1_UNCT6|nr:MAG: hypothetical protein XE03_1948 [candidate division TA06 bacterium 34_109]
MKVRIYNAQTKWLRGTKAETKIREFKVVIDKPLELRGTNIAPIRWNYYWLPWVDV